MRNVQYSRILQTHVIAKPTGHFLSWCTFSCEVVILFSLMKKKHSRSKATNVSLSKKLNFLVLVSSRKRFERWFHSRNKIVEGLMEDWHACKISPLVRYRQSQVNLLSMNTCVFKWSFPVLTRNSCRSARRRWRVAIETHFTSNNSPLGIEDFSHLTNLQMLHWITYWLHDILHHWNGKCHHKTREQTLAITHIDVSVLVTMF